MYVEDIEFSSAGAHLRGTISAPDALSGVPGLVLIGGSGPADRHNGGLFDSVREHFIRSGVAVLAYDKRGVGGSTGRWENATVDDLAADAAAALDALRGQKWVADGAVGAFGHSEGGWVALRLAVGPRAPAHLILNSCPAVTFLEAEVFALNSGGLAPSEAAAGGSLLERLTSLAEAGEGLESGQRLVAAVEEESWYPKLEAAGFTLDETAWAQLRSWGSYGPLIDLSRLTVPTLATLGADDPLIPVPRTMDLYHRSALVSGRIHQTDVFPGAGHRLQMAGTEDFAPGYLNRLSDWVWEQATSPASPRR